jgi:two-component system, NtrC family, nitrogen regulation response regulator GlnG
MTGDDPAPTLVSSERLLGDGDTRLPTLTVLWHPDLRRVGDRTVLSALLVGHPSFVSRELPDFCAVGAKSGGPLEDEHVSRTPIRFSPGADGAIDLDGFGRGARVDDVPATGRIRVSHDSLDRGVLIELGGRVLLLLHLVRHREHSAVGDLLGQSDAIETVRKEVLRVADLDASVLIRGDTGTGKELVADAIHRHSARASASYVAVNMATLPESVAASMLFGHAKGAFTGAQQRHRGFFERAHGGTLMLDELGETPRCVQPMLLRAVETRRILPLGDETERRVDVRFVAATDADLESGIEIEAFSAALVHRLSGYEIRVPPLRERAEDVALLFLRFLTEEWRTAGNGDVAGAGVPVTLIARLVRHGWPGNVRQLRNFTRQLAIANRGAVAFYVPAALERELRSERPVAEPAGPDRRARRAAEITNEELLATLERVSWAPGRAAEELGIPTGTLHSLMRRCPGVRRAADLDDREVMASYEAHRGDLNAMAAALHVSPRGLRIALTQRNIVGVESA